MEGVPWTSTSAPCAPPLSSRRLRRCGGAGRTGSINQAREGGEMITQTGRADVVIVGAGPTGLTAAARLAQLGVAHVVVDADVGPTRESRAALLHAATLEILDEVGVAGELIAAGVRVNRIGFCDRGRIIARIGLAGVPSRYQFALGVPQSTTEQVLVARLGALGGSIRRGHQAGKVTAVPEGYLVTGTGPAGAGAARFGISARYVIGCDGAHSIVRSSAGLGFPGSTYPSQFVLADAELRAAPGPDDEARIFTSPHGVVVTGRLPSGNHRVVATVDAGVAVPDPPGRAFLDAILRERGVGQLAAEPGVVVAVPGGPPGRRPVPGRRGVRVRGRRARAQPGRGA